MKMHSLLMATSVCFASLVACTTPAQTDELRVVSALGMYAVMQDLGPKFERATGHKVVITFTTMGEALKRVQIGEPADVIVVPRQGIEILLRDGKAVAGSAVPVARSGIGVAVRKGSPKPDISSPEALKRALLAAKSITYANPTLGGASGIHFAAVLERLGVANEVKAKTVFPKAGSSFAELVATGEAEIAVQQIQDLLQATGIEIVGPLPGDLQETIVFTAAITAGAKSPESAKAFKDFLRTSDAATVIKMKGMEPANP